MYLWRIVEGTHYDTLESPVLYDVHFWVFALPRSTVSAVKSFLYMVDETIGATKNQINVMELSRIFL